MSWARGCANHGAAQVVPRWHVRRGSIVFPKSVTRRGSEKDFALIDFELGAEEIQRIAALDKWRDRPQRPESRHFRLHPGLITAPAL
jgi:diketogulonate reductase-like aldo/keto reductase